MNQFDRLRALLENEFGGWLSADKLDAATKNLLDEGVIAPLCKVGDTVYTLYLDCKGYSGYKNSGCDGDCLMCKNRTYRVSSAKIVTQMQAVNVGESLGGLYFLTREEAEHALKERENSDG